MGIPKCLMDVMEELVATGQWPLLPKKNTEDKKSGHRLEVYSDHSSGKVPRRPTDTDQHNVWS